VVWIYRAGFMVIDACDDAFVVTARVHMWFGCICCRELANIFLKEAEGCVYTVYLC